MRSILDKLLAPLREERKPPPDGDRMRAIVTYHHGDIEAGKRNTYFWKNVTVRLADDPEGGPETTVATYLLRAAHGRMRVGDEIPVVVKRGTRTIIVIDAEAYEAEVA